MEDFSKLKQPAQTVVATFYTSIEPWIRPIKEEDVGFLEHTGDEVEPFIMPKLGRHYTELWEEEDMGILAMPSDADPSIFAPPDPKFEPSQLGETDVLNEEKGHGPLTERVIAALLPAPDLTWKGVKAAEDAMEGRPGGSGAAAARREKMNVTDLEARIRDTMRSNGLLDGMVCVSFLDILTIRLTIVNSLITQKRSTIPYLPHFGKHSVNYVSYLRRTRSAENVLWPSPVIG